MGSDLSQLHAPPVFIVGHHRSGTTWIFDVLTHPAGVAGVFESWMFTTDHGMGGLLHWGQWTPGFIDKAEEAAGRSAGLGQLVDRDTVTQACRQLAETWLASALKPDDHYLVEKSPDHLYAVLEISEVFPDARFINVIRDGRDVATSVLAAQAWTRREDHERGRALREAATRWRNAIDVSAKIADHLGPRYTEITYEDMKAQPVDAAKRLFEFAGIPVDAAGAQAAVDATKFGRNFEGGQDKFRRAGRTGDWKTTFSFKDRRAFARIATPALMKRGYVSSRFWWVRKPTAS